ncbi:MAG: tRNA uridine(34) 5-carboxymethylaminomethyl modification radical SAM/GNAT enzyme Elp3 [Candidatus Anstonellales archaeon]
MNSEFIRAVIKYLELYGDIDRAKRLAASETKIDRIPKNSELYSVLRDRYRDLLFRKPSRTLSGVAPVAVMVKPQGSCRWKCSYCPVSSIAPKSYTGYEPTSLRARAVNYDPYQQVMTRLHHYEIQNHYAQKLDVIVMGGTFLEMDRDYKEYFIKSIYDAVNNHISEDLESAKRYNETADRRVVGLTIETRPDVYDIEELLYYGATKIELGVQTLYDDVYEKIQRGHKLDAVISSTKELKNAGYKILYHMMLGLPGSDPDRDIEMFKILFEDPRFRPDMLKIYPTLVVPGAPLYLDYRAGLYKPYDDDTAAEVLAKIFRYIPRYVRIQRINRDIPSHKIEAGVKRANIREIATDLATKLGIHLEEIRANEAGRKGELEYNPDRAKIYEIKYEASDGIEYFISMESLDRELIYGFLRLRLPNKWSVDDIKNTAIVRELHVYGKETRIGEVGKVQHRGIGKKLMARAEEIAINNNLNISVISAVGVREYYRKLGYRLVGRYMFKNLV